MRIPRPVFYASALALAASLTLTTAACGGDPESESIGNDLREAGRSLGSAAEKAGEKFSDEALELSRRINAMEEDVDVKLKRLDRKIRNAETDEARERLQAEYDELEASGDALARDLEELGEKSESELEAFGRDVRDRLQRAKEELERPLED